MRVTLAAVGSTGDVQPYLGLAVELAAHGHEVTVATHASYAPLLAGLGLAHALVPTQPHDLLTPDVAAQSRRGGLRAARAVATAFGPHVRDIALAVDDACENADVVVHSALAWTGQHSAEGRGVPSVAAHLQPLEPTRAFPPPAISTRSLGGPVNRALSRQLQRGMAKPYLDVVNEVRTRHSLVPTTVAGVVSTMRRAPVLHGFSRHLIARPHDWRADALVTGSWWPPLPPGWVPDTALVDFLAAGPPPVCISFGSTAPLPAGQLLEVVDEATGRLGLRAVVQAGWVGLQAKTDRTLGVGQVPHAWLFPRVAAVVHHAGAGTSAAAVRAGVPSVCVPVALDQPFWAQRLHRAGVATAPLPARHLAAGSLAQALERVLTDPSLLRASRGMADLVAAERGAAAARRVIEGRAQAGSDPVRR